MKKKSHLTEEEKNLFRSAVKNSRPLKSQNRIHHAETKRKKVVDSSFQDALREHYAVSDFIDQSNFCTSNQYLSYKTTGLQNRQFLKLKQGNIVIEEIIDLHGLTVDQARKRVDSFIADCISCQFRCVIIVHGKGNRDTPPIIKTMVNHWLQQISDVIAFVSALPCDGGTGAVYVLLRNGVIKSDQKN